MVPKLVRTQEPAMEEDAESQGMRSIFTAAPEQLGSGLLGSQLQERNNSTGTEQDHAVREKENARLETGRGWEEGDGGTGGGEAALLVTTEPNYSYVCDRDASMEILFKNSKR